MGSRHHQRKTNHLKMQTLLTTMRTCHLLPCLTPCAWRRLMSHLKQPNPGTSGQPFLSWILLLRMVALVRTGCLLGIMQHMRHSTVLHPLALLVSHLATMTCHAPQHMTSKAAVPPPLRAGVTRYMVQKHRVAVWALRMVLAMSTKVRCRCLHSSISSSTLHCL